jgi:glycosyltransferase 2 family protein
MKRLIITILKVAISAGILVYLFFRTAQGDTERGNAFANLLEESKNWGILAAALASCTLAVMLTFVRWWYLVRALDIPCRFNDAIRISFWGYLINLAPLGIVGGDLIKAVMLDHEHPGYRAKSVATVLVDRVIGLYLLFVVASAAILLTGFGKVDLGLYGWICPVTHIITLVGTLVMGALMGPERLIGPVVRVCGRIPRIGRHLESLIDAVRMYRRKPKVMLVSSLMTVGVHSFLAIGCFLIAAGLPGNHPTLAQHFVIMTLSNAMGVLPLSFGPFEIVLKFFYDTVPVEGPPIALGQGFVVALAYRVITLLIAAMGIFYYFRNRREMAEVMHEAERE